MDRDTAFQKINWVFNSMENENKSSLWQCDELRKVLKQLSEDTYERGKKTGFNQAIEILKENKL
jgi:hypothetical protein